MLDLLWGWGWELGPEVNDLIWDLWHWVTVWSICVQQITILKTLPIHYQRYYCHCLMIIIPTRSSYLEESQFLNVLTLPQLKVKWGVSRSDSRRAHLSILWVPYISSQSCTILPSFPWSFFSLSPIPRVTMGSFTLSSCLDVGTIADQIPPCLHSIQGISES